MNNDLNCNCVCFVSSNMDNYESHVDIGKTQRSAKKIKKTFHTHLTLGQADTHKARQKENEEKYTRQKESDIKIKLDRPKGFAKECESQIIKLRRINNREKWQKK